MRWITHLMDFGLCHQKLPQKTYYPSSFTSLQVPHGIYCKEAKEENFFHSILQEKADGKLISILGNIRDEKNYEAAFAVLPLLKNTKLLIAGKPANSSVSIDSYKAIISQLNLQEKVILKSHYLSPAEFAAAIEASDLILLFYKSTFKSQSGILNAIAPYKKKLLVSDAPSPLLSSVKQFQIGHIAPLNNSAALARSIDLLLQTRQESFNDGWVQYVEAANWNDHVNIVVQEMQNRL